MGCLHAQAISVNLYLGDWLVHNSSYQITLINTQTTLTIETRLGCILSLEKSNLIPKQHIQFMNLVLAKGLVFPTWENIFILEKVGHLICSLQQIKACSFLCILGFMNYAVGMIPLGRLHMGPIQLYLLALLRLATGQLSDIVPV